MTDRKMWLYLLGTPAELPALAPSRQYAYYVLSENQLYVPDETLALIRLNDVGSVTPQNLGNPIVITWSATIPDNWEYTISELNVYGNGELNVVGTLIQEN